MVQSNDTTDLADGDLRSFLLADLVVEASDQNAAIHLIAVGISYTADERDSNRALVIGRHVGKRRSRSIIVSLPPRTGFLIVLPMQ